ncbi:MAG: 4'-phosphopantetheinyl transferase superfamily protein, partial [Acidobacteriota bacterium]
GSRPGRPADVSAFPPGSLAGLLLPAGEVHIWFVDLDPPAGRVEALGRSLAQDEWDRANRFRFDRHRRQYVVGRGALRALLGACTGTRPELVRFTYGPRGKPFLAPPFSLSPGTGERAGERGDGINDSGDLFFNLSNSDERALVGFVRGREIGVDIEFLKPMPDCEQIAERFFSESERVVLRGVPQASKEEAFFNCWTRKEAYLKAVGEGLAAPLDSFDVTLAPGEPPRMLTLRGDADAAARWWLEHFRLSPEHIGALALERRDPEERWAVRTWSFE